MDGTSQKRPNKSTPFSFWSCQTKKQKRETKDRYQEQSEASTHSSKQSMSSNRSNDINNEININNQEDDSSTGSAFYVRFIPGNDPTDSETEGSVDSQLSRPKLTIKVTVQYGSKEGITEFTSIKVTQDDFHECRVYTVDPVKQRQTEKRGGLVTKVWSSAAGPLIFELEVREKPQPPQLFGPLTKEKTKQWEAHELSLKRKREDPFDQREEE